MAVTAMIRAYGGALCIEMNALVQHKGGQWYVWYTAVWQRHQRACVSRVVPHRMFVQGGGSGGLRKGRALWVRGVCSDSRGVRCAHAVLPCGPDIHAQPQAEMLGQDSATLHGAGCGVQCTRSGREGLGRREPDAREQVCAADAVRSFSSPWAGP